MIALGGRRFLLTCAVVAAAVLLALGFSLPFMRLGKLVYLGYGAEGHSLLSAVNALMRSGQHVLGGMLLVFGLLLPLLKLLYPLLLAALSNTDVSRSAAQLRTLAWLGRWSPQDLLALALAAALIASREALVLHTADGAYLFAAAVLVMALAGLWLPGLGASRLRTAARTAQAATARGYTFSALAMAAAVAFGLGVTLPAVRLTGAYAGTDLHSALSMVWALQERGETTPWLVLATLAVVLPGLRVLHLVTLTVARALPGALRTGAVLATGVLGRYAIADTMLLSLMLLYLIATGTADAALQPGAYCLAASALLTLLAFGWSHAPAPIAASAQPSTLASRLAGLASTGGRTQL